jgi:protoporphyrin/coproporphyrin ferrochelatase
LGVLVMAYGTPRILDEVLPYYTHIRRGRPPSKEQLEDLTRRYQAIGGVSPLTEITNAQCQGIADALHADGGRPIKLYQGLKHTYPYIEEAVEKMHADGIEEAVCLILAPHYSTMSVASYLKSAQTKADELGGPKLYPVKSWHMQPRFLNLLADRVEEALAKLTRPNDAMVVFSAHSLPEKILALGDPYPSLLEESGHAVAKMLELPHYTFAWQSAGQTGEPWLSPDILDKLKLLKEEGYTQIVSCSQGFVADHLEVLYDIDMEAQEVAKNLGITLVRTQQMNADPAFVKMLAQVVRSRYAQGDCEV